jgi:hypothetical protein
MTEISGSPYPQGTTITPDRYGVEIDRALIDVVDQRQTVNVVFAA